MSTSGKGSSPAEAGHVFISHASADDAFVEDLHTALEGQGVSVWVDSRKLRDGDKLAPEIEQAIENAGHFLAVLSPKAVKSDWVRREVEHAVEIAEAKGDGYRVIPLLLPGVELDDVPSWFGAERVAETVGLDPGDLQAALPHLLAALGEQLPDDRKPDGEARTDPVEELQLRLVKAQVVLEDGKDRARAEATVIFNSSDPAADPLESTPFTFNAPLGPIEAEELRWYLEEYFRWPVGVFQERAARVEEQLPEWGRLLYEAALGGKAARTPLNAWLGAGENAARRFSVWVDSAVLDEAPKEEQAAAMEAASALLSLPWELLHDEDGYLFRRGDAVRVRRRLPNRRPRPRSTASLPIRILLVSPRPEDEKTRYIDHRVSARPLVDAVEGLGELVQLTVLTPPTFDALQAELTRARRAGESYDVVHFDGHGVYDRKRGLGALCFEDPKDTGKLQKRAMELIDAEKMAGVIRDHGIPVVFLEACETAKVEDAPSASVAAKLLEQGVTSVVAMSHSVLVETARRFVAVFYQELAEGARVGNAMLAGQQKLESDTYRGKMMGVGDLRLQDWFVPVLYQERRDPPLVTRVPSDEVRRLQAIARKRSMGALPETPKHTFVGRSRELLMLERLLHEKPYAVVRGLGGSGKTTLAVELARWLVRTGRFERAAFVSLENALDARSVVDTLGHQLLPEGKNYSVGQFKGLKQALQPIERALRDHPTIIVLDNFETILATEGTEETGTPPTERDPKEIGTVPSERVPERDGTVPISGATPGATQDATVPISGATPGAPRDETVPISGATPSAPQDATVPISGATPDATPDAAAPIPGDETHDATGDEVAPEARHCEERVPERRGNLADTDGSGEGDCRAPSRSLAMTGSGGDAGEGGDGEKGTVPSRSGTHSLGTVPISPEESVLSALLTLCQDLLDAHPATRIVFTSREPLPPPYDNGNQCIGLGALSRTDAIELVSHVMTQEGVEPEPSDAGETPEEITALVESVNCHARALVLLSREVARRGVRATTADLHQFMAELDEKHPDDRENSLFASVELSLRRLPAEVREQVKALAVFHGGASMGALQVVLDRSEDDRETIPRLCAALIDVGLAEEVAYGHLRFDPALPTYLLGELTEAEGEQFHTQWVEAMAQLALYLSQQRSKDAQLAQRLVLLELPNFIALLDWLSGHAAPEVVTTVATCVERMLAKLGRSRALAMVIRVREKAAHSLGEWSHAQYLACSIGIDRMLDAGDLQSARYATQELLQRCLAAGEKAYPGAEYDTAMAHFEVGRTLQMGGNAEAALEPLAEARRRFRALATEDDTGAERMATVATTESADCLKDLGRLDEAGDAYEEAIALGAKREDKRSVAVNKGQLANVRRKQQRYDEALELYAQVGDTFEGLDEPRQVALTWHHIGLVHSDTRQFEQAERAFRESLAIRVRDGDRAGEASSLSELGSLYEYMGRPEEAVAFYRRAADIFVGLGNLWREGTVRSNLASSLIHLNRCDEAREELLRAIECAKPHGHAAEQWITWNVLSGLERAVGNADAAAEARQRAIECYLAYRREGGENPNLGAKLCAVVVQAIQQGDNARAEDALTQLAGRADAPDYLKVLVPKLQGILHGDRDPRLADDPELDYDDAVELMLLLERLQKG